MSRGRVAVSLFVLWHISALAVVSVPVPGDLPRPDVPRHPTQDRLVALLTPSLDFVATWAGGWPNALWTATSAVRPLASTYTRIIGFPQHWNMFWGPRTGDEYLRMRYYVGSDLKAPPTRVVTELVYPTEPETRVRGLASYRSLPVHKTIDSALMNFSRRAGERQGRSHEPAAAPPDDLAPIARYFSRRFAARELVTGEHVVRVEVWWGWAEIPPRGDLHDEATRAEREAVLDRYYAGPAETLSSLSTPSLLAEEREADISWVLEYVE